MRNLVALGAAVLFVSSVGVAGAQEVLPQHSGFGTGVGENAGVGSRSQIWDKNALLERLSQPETVMGRIFGIDFAQGRLFIETGGTGRNEEAAAGVAGAGARTVMTLYLSDRSNIQAIKQLNTGDEVAIQAREETTKAQPYGTGKKIALTVTVMRGVATQEGYGGFGQRPNPDTERAINTSSGSTHGGVTGQVMPGSVKGNISSPIGAMTGSAPCWQCDPQPGYGYPTNKTDYGDYDKLNFKKGQ